MTTRLRGSTRALARGKQDKNIDTRGLTKCDGLNKSRGRCCGLPGRVNGSKVRRLRIPEERIESRGPASVSKRAPESKSMDSLPVARGGDQKSELTTCRIRQREGGPPYQNGANPNLHAARRKGRDKENKKSGKGGQGWCLIRQKKKERPSERACSLPTV